MTKRHLACLALAASMGITVMPSAPALADGAASTRNIIGGAAIVGGALLIINHNRKVHQKYAEYDRRQAYTQAQANNAEAAYASERQAYGHEAALVAGYKREVAIQHQEVLRLRHEVAMSRRNNVHVASAPGATGPLVAGARVERTPSGTRIASNAPSYGWGSL
jgi:hypothetical protein